MKASISKIVETLSKNNSSFKNLNASEHNNNGSSAKIIDVEGKSIINNPEYVIETLLTDSRNIQNHSKALFFAIRTPGGNDGHNFIESLYHQGVKNFIVEEIPQSLANKSDVNLIKVDNSVKALGEVGGLGRSLAKEIVAISGSRGKTTLKEWIFQLMEPIKQISRSPRSYNSKIGVPLSVWQIQENSDIAIIEAGISKKGEMIPLSEIINPETVIFTNIGDEHSEGFESKQEKAKEKALLASGTNVKTIIYNTDDLILNNALLPYLSGKEIIGWSFKNPSAPLVIKSTNLKEDGSADIKFIWRNSENELTLPYGNRYNLENSIGALAFMLYQGISPEVIRTRFKMLHKIGTRLNVSEGINRCSIILDSYTSDVTSLQPALNFMLRRKMPYQTPTLIMSDIRHEAGNLPDAYSKIANIVKESGIRKFIGVGREMKQYQNLFDHNSLFFNSTEELISHLSASDFLEEIILLKGAPEFDFNKINEMLEARMHETVLEVNLDSIVANFNYFRSHLPSTTGLIAMVKASGYGAGSYEIAKTLQDCGAAYLAVAVLDEGIELRKNGIIMPIMVMNPRSANYKPMFAYGLEPEIYSLSMLEDVVKEAIKNNISDYPIHIKLDTGMHRMGFIEEELPQVIKLLTGQKAVKVSSIFSHLATADCPDMDDYTNLQLERFQKMSSVLIDNLPYKVNRHILNSAGILRFPEHHYDFARLGIGLYGANTLPVEYEKPLAVVSTLRTVIINIREWNEGETIGYSRKGILKRKSRIATIPVGYADGIDRHFGNGAISVRINGKDAPTIGNICMDASMVDVTDVDCKVGDSVEIFGKQADLQRLADALGTIPYEILTSVSPRVKRVYYRE